jgi:hypothetical protein
VSTPPWPQRRELLLTVHPLFMKMNQSSTLSADVSPYPELRRKIHDALRLQNPEWIEPNGECPICDSYESRFAEQLRLSLKSSDNGPGRRPYRSENNLTT